MIGQHEFYSKCMGDELRGQTGGGRGAVRLRFIEAAKACRNKYCAEVALEEILKSPEDSDTIRGILKEHCDCCNRE